MTQQERQGERMGANMGANLGSKAQEFVAEGRQRLEDVAGAQSELWDKIQNANRKWLDRMQSEASVAADFASRVTAARSLTETASLLQNWTAKHLEMATEDARRALSDTQEIFAAGARFWTNMGGDGKGRGN